MNAVKKYQGFVVERNFRRNIFSKNYISDRFDWSFCYEGFSKVFDNITPEKSFAIARFLNPKVLEFDIQGDITGAEDRCFSGKNVDSIVGYSMIGLILTYEKWIYIKEDELPHSPLEVEKEMIRDEYKCAGRLMQVIPFKQVNNVLYDWLKEHCSNPEEVDQYQAILRNPDDLFPLLNAVKRSQAKQMAAKKKKTTVSDLLKNGDKDQKGECRENDELSLSPISEQAMKRREKKYQEELSASLGHYTHMAKGVQFTYSQSNDEERAFLKQEYDGYCQICLKRIMKYNGDPYFEAINLLKFSKLPEELRFSSKYGWNSLCLCPNCAAEYNYSSKKISTMYEQIMNLEVVPGSDEPISIVIELPAGKKRKIQYSPRHFIALKEALKMYAEYSKDEM